MDPSTTRVLIYSHDTFGLGHLRRCLTIADALTSASEHTSVMIVTGSTRVGSFDLPERCEAVKLPAVTKASDGTYRARALGVSLEEIIRMRAEMLTTVGLAFRPSVVLVDHAPVGVEGELTPMLEALRRGWPRPKMVIGLRDVIDEVDAVRAEWDRVGAWTALDALYDRILVYGDREYLTTASELGLELRYAGKLRFVGYLGRRSRRPLRPVTHGRPTILVTVGGGGDGGPILSAYASFLASVGRSAPFRSVIVTGPFLAESELRTIGARLRASGAPVEIVTFTDRLETVLEEAKGVVSMCGYNTVVELLAARVPALIIPRRVPRAEQTLRAQRLGPAAGFDVCPIDELHPSRIAAFVDGVLEGTLRAAPKSSIEIDGLPNVIDEILGSVPASSGVPFPPAVGIEAGQDDPAALPLTDHLPHRFGDDM